MSDYDITIIGGGAAGLSAALVLSRARRRVLVLDAGAPRNAAAEHMHGFLSRDGMPPAEFLTAGRAEAAGYGAEFAAGRADRLVPDGRDGLWVLVGERRISTRRVLVATGLRDELPDIPGLRERWARDVLHCPYCHGREVADRRLAVLGWTAESVRFAQTVRQWSADITYVARPGILTAADRAEFAARGIDVLDGDVSQLVVRDDRLRGLALDDGREVTVDALFVPPRFVPHDGLLRDIGCRTDERGWVTVDPTGRTSVRGVWSAGNVVDARAQVITAAGAGSAAAIAINADLVEDDIRLAMREARHGLALTT